METKRTECFWLVNITVSVFAITSYMLRSQQLAVLLAWLY